MYQRPNFFSRIRYETVIEVRKQAVGTVISTDQQYAIHEDHHMYTTWASLDPDDKINLEARLLTEAEAIGVKFAHLCTKARDSFEERDVRPQMLADTLMDLTVYKPGSSFHGIIPLLKEEDGTLVRAQSVREIFHALSPHMSFFNYEILQFLIEGKGSEGDKVALDTYLKHFTEFCRRHVFEVPLTMYSSGQQIEGHKVKQRLHIKVTKHFKAAFLVRSTTEVLPITGDESQTDSVCSSKLGMSLEDAKNIQIKLANILHLQSRFTLFGHHIRGKCNIDLFTPKMCVTSGLRP
jgi:hypothetical protein